MHAKSNSVSTDNGQTSRLSIFYCVSNHKKYIPKYLENALTDFAQTSRTSRPLLEEKGHVNDFGRTVLSAEKYCCKHFVAMTTPMSLQP